MKSGPPPKPTVLKKLAGNPGRKPLPENEPIFPIPSRMPPVPDHLSDDAKAAWRKFGPMLLNAGLLTSADVIAFEMLCTSYGTALHAQHMTRETGGEILESSKGNLYQNPWTFVANKAWDQLLRMLAHFGMTPAERSRVIAEVQKGEEPSIIEMLYHAPIAEDDA